MANKINIENYEAFLLDYIEGTLSTEDLVSLQIFAAQHPHLNIDLNDMELVELNAATIAYEGKNELKKISDEQFVAYIENELNAEEKQNLETLCNLNPTLAAELKLYRKTLLSADETIVFENKASLKKQEAKVLWLFSREVLAAAASLVLLLGLWFVFKGSLGTSDLNSEKIKGNSTIKTFAIRTKSSAPSFTVEKVNETLPNNNQVAYSVKNKNMETPKEETSKEETPQLVNNVKENKPEPQKELVPQTSTVAAVDNGPVKVASNPSTTKSYIITEEAFDKDEHVLASNGKKGFWNRAMKALNGLNKLGVKKAKGTETVEQTNEQYVLTMGNFKVENHKYNAE
jgi:hypothetical protein